MDRINGADTVDIGGGKRGFRAENLVAGVAGTEVTADWLNSVQEELLRVVSEAGIAPNAADWSQLWQALKAMGLSSGSRSRRWMAVNSMILSSAPGSPAEGDAYLIPTGATGIWAANVGKIAEWSSTAWSYFTPSDGHGIALPDGRIFERIGGSYLEKPALDAQSGRWTFATAAGAANAIVVTLDPAPQAVAAGFEVRVKITANNSGPVTLNVNGLGAKPVVLLGSRALTGGELIAGSIVSFQFDGINFIAGDGISAAAYMGQVLFRDPGPVSFVVPEGVTQIEFELWGGGAGGGGVGVGGNGSAGGGGAGGYGRKRKAVVPGQVLSGVVGPGGVGGSPGGTGAAGGTTSFAGEVTCDGGSGGSPNPTGNGGSGGLASGGDLTATGGAGTAGAAGGSVSGGPGGSSSFGGAGGGGGFGVAGGGSSPGGGGGGSGSATANSGGAGAAGAIFIKW